MGKTYINIAVDKALHDEVMLFKIKTNARSCGAVIKKAIKLLKLYTRK